MLPAHIISYVYGGNDVGVHNVTYAIRQHENTNSLEVKIIDPPSLAQATKDKGVESKEPFKKIIEPVHLFKYLKNFDLDEKDYEITLNPVRYRHNLITSILKQYLRENMFIGELEVESIAAKKGGK